MVKDLSLSKKFYEDMFGLREKISYGEDLLFLQNSHGFDLALTPTENPQSLPKGVHFGFSVNEKNKLDEIYRMGKERYPQCFQETPKNHGNWGTLICKDPDGYHFEIYWDENLRPTK
jgi:predicted lactoylglutathione lyase